MGSLILSSSTEGDDSGKLSSKVTDILEVVLAVLSGEFLLRRSEGGVRHGDCGVCVGVCGWEAVLRALVFVSMTWGGGRFGDGVGWVACQEVGICDLGEIGDVGWLGAFDWSECVGEVCLGDDAGLGARARGGAG
ncbi:hypothetical protein Tco_0071907 [Tanacetum coccineum]